MRDTVTLRATDLSTIKYIMYCVICPLIAKPADVFAKAPRSSATRLWNPLQHPRQVLPTLNPYFPPGIAKDPFADRADELAAFFQSTSDAAALADAAPELQQQTRRLMQATFAVLQAALPASVVPPAQLHVDGFDAEQIWAQVDEHCAGGLKRARCARHVIGHQILSP